MLRFPILLLFTVIVSCELQSVISAGDVPLNVFLTGATGYIGGEFLFKLLNDPKPNYKIRALVRSQQKSDLLLSKTNNSIETVIGDLNDSKLLLQEFSNADIIINAASNNHLSSVKVLEEAILNKNKKSDRITTVFHISGVSIISTIDDHDYWSDIKDNRKITNLGDERPHIQIDRTIWNLQSQVDNVRTVIISPANIFGTSNGFDHIYSSQIPDLIKYSLKLGKVFTVEDGSFRWSHVHISELGNLFLLLLNKLIEDKDSIKTGKEGYYFISTGEHEWSEVSKKLAAILYKKGAIETDQVVSLSRDEVNDLTGADYAPLWGTYALTKPDLANSLGWQPIESKGLFWEELAKSANL